MRTAGFGRTRAELDELEWWEVQDLLAYWREFPPPHVSLSVIARFVGWKPNTANQNDPVAHQRSLEARWKAGAMNMKQIFEASGGQPISVQG